MKEGWPLIKCPFVILTRKFAWKKKKACAGHNAWGVKLGDVKEAGVTLLKQPHRIKADSFHGGKVFKLQRMFKDKQSKVFVFCASIQRAYHLFRPERGLTMFHLTHVRGWDGEKQKWQQEHHQPSILFLSSFSGRISYKLSHLCLVSPLKCYQKTNSCLLRVN